MTEFIPKIYQKMMLDHIDEHERCALYADMGLGKTVTTLTSIANNLERLKKPTLVIAPLYVAKFTWKDEVAKWSHLKDLSLQVISGDAKARTKCIQNKDANIFTINYEAVPWLYEYAKEHGWKFGKIIVDESNNLKSYRRHASSGSKRAKIINKFAFLHKEMVHLSGTPAPNGLLDLWGQLWFLDKGARLGQSYTAFRDRWFYQDKDQFTYKMFRHSAEEIQNAIRDICMSVRVRDYFDIEAPIVVKHYVELPSKVRAMYNSMKRTMLAQIETMLTDGVDSSVRAHNAAIKTNKLLQIASGVVYLEDNDEESDHVKYKTIHDLKLQALESIINENAGHNFLVAYEFKPDCDRILKAFPQAVHIGAHGDTIRDWNLGKIPMLVLHPKSAGDGLNLQDGGSRIVFYTAGWSLKNYMQVIERIGPARQKQSGHDVAVYHYHIMAKDTMDDRVLERLHDKREVQDILLDEIKRSKNDYR